VSLPIVLTADGRRLVLNTNSNNLSGPGAIVVAADVPDRSCGRSLGGSRPRAFM
jgi:hypothetical protein